MPAPTETTRAAPLAQVRTISHVAIEVSNLDASIDFYARVLGFEIFEDARVGGRPPNVKGTIAGFGFELAQAPQSGCTDPSDRRAAWVGAPCLSFSVEDLPSAFHRLKAAGCVSAAAPTEVRGAKFFFLTDPDGLQIELIEFPAGVSVLADLRTLA